MKRCKYGHKKGCKRYGAETTTDPCTCDYMKDLSKSFKKHVEEARKSPEYWKEMYELLREETNNASVLKPELSLLVKLASIAVHTEEYLSPKGHQFDVVALKALLNDAQVKKWLAEMNKNAFLPIKR